MKAYQTIFALGLLAIMPMSANGQIGLTSVPFLRIEPDARSGALGNTGVTLLDGRHAGYWNPAVLGFQPGRSVGFTYSEWLPGMADDYRFNHFVGNVPVNERSSVSAYLTYFNLGTQTATDAFGASLGSFGSYQFSAGVSYGWIAGRHWSLGAGAKYIHSNLAAGQTVDGVQIDPASSLALDAGALFRSGSLSVGSQDGEFRVGASLSNFGPGITYADSRTRTALPLVFRAGWAIELNTGVRSSHRFTLSNDITRLLSRMEMSVSGGDTVYTSMNPGRALVEGWGSLDRFNGQEMVKLGFLEQFTFGTGLEYWYNHLFALRAGYYHEHPDNGDRTFATFGAGLRYNAAEVDFSYLHALEEDHPLAGTVRVSLKVHFDAGNVLEPRDLIAGRDRGSRQKKDKGKSAPSRDAVAAVQPLEPSQPAPPVGDPVRGEDEPVPSDDVVAQEMPAEEAQDQAIEAIPVASRQMPVLPLDEIASELETISMALRGFATMSSELTQENRDAVARLVVMMQRYPGLQLTIEGHTDSRGSEAVNEMLGEARARAIWIEMLSYGVIHPDRLLWSGRAASEPIASNDSPAGRRMNRRGDMAEPVQVQDVPASWGRAMESSGVDAPGTSDPAGVPVLSYNPSSLLNSGSEIRFSMIDFLDETAASTWLDALASMLDDHPAAQLAIASHAAFQTGGERFLTELTKARSEKLKSMLMMRGVEPARIVILTPADGRWQELVAPRIPEGTAERTYFIAL